MPHRQAFNRTIGNPHWDRHFRHSVYETQGLIHPGRNAGGQRQFQRSDIRRLGFVRIAQQFGFTSDQICEQLRLLSDARTSTKAE